MTDAVTTPRTLIEALEAEVARDAAAILDDALGKASEIRAEAHRRSRQRFAQAAASLRRERAADLARASAEIARARHQDYLAENARMADAGLSLIEASLREVWADAGHRAEWCRNAIRMACALLGDVERFVVEHPEGLPGDTRQAILDAMQEACCSAPRLEAAGDLQVGLRLRSEHACLDAGMDGLMRDRMRIAGEYLALLGRSRGGADV